MKSKLTLTHDDVARILDAARQEALKNNLGVTIAVSDDGGHLLGLIRLDGAPPMSAAIAPGKARAAAMGRRDSRLFEEMINQGRTAFVTAPGLGAMLEGGLPIIVDGQCVGAIGISGVKSIEDSQIAQAGIAAVVPEGAGAKP